MVGSNQSYIQRRYIAIFVFGAYSVCKLYVTVSTSVAATRSTVRYRYGCNLRCIGYLVPQVRSVDCI